MIASCFGNAYAQSDDRTTIPDGEWTVLGEGTYYEDVFTMMHWQRNNHWPVTVEESVEQPGWYRFVAYGDGCPESISKYLPGTPDNESYMYINATDPERAFIPVSTFGGSLNVCSYVVENQFDSEKYLNFTDGTFTGPEGCIAYQAVGAGERWSLGNFFENFRLVLPESTSRDYRFKISATKSCSEDNTFTYTIETIGVDVKSYKACIVPGYFNGTAEEIEYADIHGTAIHEGDNTCKGDSRGRYSLIVISYGDNNDIGAVNSTYFYYMDDEADQWLPLGEATYYEDVLGSIYPDMTTEKLTVDIEVHKDRPGYFRIVEPYKNHPYFLNYTTMYRPHDNHKHYLYINAEDPEAVYLEDMPAGVNLGYGDASIFSAAYKYLCDGLTKEEIADLDLFGTHEGREITFPDNSLILVERQYKNGLFVQAEAPMFRITLPKSAGIDEIATDADGGQAIYYNLQGVRVDNPSGGMFIRRQGRTTEKVIIQ